MKQLAAYIGYIMGIAGFAMFIWQASAKYQKGEDQSTSTKEEVKEIKESMITKADWRTFADSICAYNERMERKQDEVISRLNSLRGSYVKYVSRDSTLTYKEFREYMEGIEFELKKKFESNLLMTPWRL